MQNSWKDTNIIFILVFFMFLGMIMMMYSPLFKNESLKNSLIRKIISYIALISATLLFILSLYKTFVKYFLK